MYRFLLTPKWIIGIVLAAVAIVGFSSLGLWQLRRLDERRAFNADVAAGMAAEPVGVDQVGPDDRYRHVTVTGTYKPEEEVLLVGRTRDGRPGHHVLTPLVTPSGEAVLVDRGWVPLALDSVPVREAAPPAGEVTVTGFVREARRGAAATQGRVAQVREVNVDRLADQVSAPLLPFSVQLETQRPPQAELPLPPEPPVLDEGSHLSYAVQWFLFAGIVAIGFPVLVRHTARSAGGAGG